MGHGPSPSALRPAAPFVLIAGFRETSFFPRERRQAGAAVRLAILLGEGGASSGHLLPRVPVYQAPQGALSESQSEVWDAHPLIRGTTRREGVGVGGGGGGLRDHRPISTARCSGLGAGSLQLLSHSRTAPLFSVLLLCSRVYSLHGSKATYLACPHHLSP